MHTVFLLVRCCTLACVIVLASLSSGRDAFAMSKPSKAAWPMHAFAVERAMSTAASALKYNVDAQPEAPIGSGRFVVAEAWTRYWQMALQPMLQFDGLWDRAGMSAHAWQRGYPSPTPPATWEAQAIPAPLDAGRIAIEPDDPNLTGSASQTSAAEVIDVAVAPASVPEPGTAYLLSLVIAALPGVLRREDRH